MNHKDLSLQDSFLMAAKDNEITVFLVNGIKLQGSLVNFDRYCIKLTGSAGSKQLIFKHAISTICHKNGELPYHKEKAQTHTNKI